MASVFNAASYFIDRHLAEGRADRIAVECGDERLTYGALAARIDRLGHALRHRLTIRRGERIVLVMLDGPDFICSFFAAIKIGAIPIPTNTLWKPAEYAYVLDDSRAVAVIVSEPLAAPILAMRRERAAHLRSIVVSGGRAPSETQSFDELIAGGAPNLEPEPTDQHDPAFWLYSSGSTGLPKGCIHLQDHMMVCADRYARGVLGITADDRAFSVAKLFFAYGLGNAMYFPFAVGATAILWPGPPTAANVYAVIERHRPTLIFSVPTSYAMLLALHRDGQDFDLSSVRHAVSAGESLPAALFHRFEERFGIQILDGIGSTEALHIFISNRPGAIRPGSSGRVVPGYETKVVDDDGHAVAPGQIGNLFVKGASLCAGYWNQSARTRSVMDGNWMRTGDKYSQDDEGFYWYAGRTDDMLKAGGIWVSPVEIENALVEHDAVLECAVIGREDRDGLMKPAAYVVLAHGVAASDTLANELIEWVRQRLPDYKRPRRVEFIDALPKTATGKIQRFKLREDPKDTEGTEDTKRSSADL